MAVDYTASTVAGATITVTKVFRIGQGCVMPQACNVTAIYGWMTSNNNTGITLALCKVTPDPTSTSALQPVVVDEVAITGGNSNDKLVAINETTITTPALAAGDIIFPMVKEASAGSTIYFNVNIQTTAF